MILYAMTYFLVIVLYTAMISKNVTFGISISYDVSDLCVSTSLLNYYCESNSTCMFYFSYITSDAKSIMLSLFIALTYIRTLLFIKWVY